MNIYYTLEKWDLEIVAILDRENCSYEFDMFVVWKDKKNRLYYASDSGCSCPSPFENTGLADLVQATKSEVLAAADEWNKYYDNTTKASPGPMLEFKDKIRNLRKSKV